jgi:hypothetical protein
MCKKLADKPSRSSDQDAHFRHVKADGEKDLVLTALRRWDTLCEMELEDSPRRLVLNALSLLFSVSEWKATTSS